MADYASDLLSTKVVEPGTGATDYASDLLGPKYQERAPTAFQQLPLENRDSLKGTASFSTLVKAAMVDDPATKVRIFARNRFPDMSEQKAMERYGVVGGEVVYLGEDDKLYRETPPGAAGTAKGFGANMLGNALPIAGGTAGAILGANLPAPGTATALGALGAATGKGLQQIISNVALGEPQTVGGNIGGMATEAGFAAGGNLVGSGLAKWIDRNTARDIGKLNMGAVADLRRKASDVGGTGMAVDLNAGQLSNVPSIKGRAEALARNPFSMDAMNDALEKTSRQASEAADAYVSQYARTPTSVRAGGEAGRTGANAILDRVAAERSAAARPIYQKAFATAVVDPKDEGLQRLLNADEMREAVQRGFKIANTEGLDLAKPGNEFQVLHYAKLALDAKLEPLVAATQGVSTTEKRALTGLKNRLLEYMDNVSPDYAQARQIYAHFTPAVKTAREGLIGQLAELADEDLVRASRQVFSPQNAPQDIAALRAQFTRYGQQEQWQKLTAGYLQDTLEQASKETRTGAGRPAPTWRYMMLGNPKQAQNLRAAMTADQWQSFGDMMDVFEAVNRVRGVGQNSMTAEMLQQSKMMEREAGSKLAAILDARRRAVQWLDEARLGKHVDTQVEILNSPDGIKRLKELRQMSPNDRAFLQGFTTLVGASASPEEKAKP